MLLKVKKKHITQSTAKSSEKKLNFTTTVVKKYIGQPVHKNEKTKQWEIIENVFLLSQEAADELCKM